MNGKSNIIEALNSLLEGELTAIDQYFIHSRIFEDQGIHQLYEQINHEMEDEKEHASALIRRILFLEGKPDLTKRQQINTGIELIEMLKYDLDLEYSVIANLKRVIALCETEKDFVTRDLLVGMLEDTEHDHTHWLEQQLGLIERMGKENYISIRSEKHE